MNNKLLHLRYWYVTNHTRYLSSDRLNHVIQKQIAPVLNKKKKLHQLYIIYDTISTIINIVNQNIKKQLRQTKKKIMDHIKFCS